MALGFVGRDDGLNRCIYNADNKENVRKSIIPQKQPVYICKSAKSRQRTQAETRQTERQLQSLLKSIQEDIEGL